MAVRWTSDAHHFRNARTILLTDCLSALPPVRAGAAILQRDQDLDVIARQSAPRIV